MSRGGLEQEAGERLTTCATVLIVVIADQNLKQRQGRKKGGVDRFHDVPSLGPTGYVGLVRDTDQEKTSSLQ